MGGLFGVPPLFAADPGDWVGVWSLSFGNSEEGTVRWVIANDQGKLSAQQYNSTWRTVAITSTFSESSLTVTSRPGAYKISATVTREGDRFSGTWKLLHPQFGAEQPVTGVRVVKANHWDPLEGIRRLEDPAGIVDICSALRKSAAGKDFQKFAAGWDTEIGGPYYLFLESFWDPDPARKSEKLRRLYSLLRSGQFQDNVKKVLALRTEVTQLVKDKDSSFYFANPTVVVPTFSSEKASAMDVVDGKVYVTAEVPQQLPARSYPRMKWMMAKEQLKLAFLARFPLQMRAAPIELIREGISAYLAADLVKVSLVEILGTTPAQAKESVARLADYRKVLGQVGSAEVEQVKAHFRDDPLSGRQIIDMVGYKFGEQVVKRFKAEELAKLDRGRLLELVNNYLQSGS